jgi:hypothetical protein
MMHTKPYSHVLSTIAGVALLPLTALAQDNTASQRAPQTPPAFEGTADPAPAGAPMDSSDTAQSPDPTGENRGSAPEQTRDTGREAQNGGNASGTPQRRDIDPAEIQKVFGSDVNIIDLKSLTAEQARTLQSTLKERGFYRGAVDGVVGPQTRAALGAMVTQQFTLNQRLINQGKITEPIAARMGISLSELAPVRGVDEPTPTPEGSRMGSSMNQGSMPRGNGSSSATSGSSMTGNSRGSSSTNSAPPSDPSNGHHGSGSNPRTSDHPTSSGHPVQ